jgi:hypothetical protein
MMRRCLAMLLPVLALSTTLLGGSVRARQEEAIPGVAIETLGRSPVGESGDELVLLRVTIEPSETILTPGDAVSSGKGTRLTFRNAGDSEAMLLYAVVTTAGASPFAASAEDATGTFSVETFACPEGMTLATLESDACEPSAASLVHWSLASEQFDAPFGADEATVSGATTTWRGLPSGTYFVDLIAESFASGYGDYFIPSSNQVTRQDERTPRIYFDAIRSRDSINAYVFVGDPAGP